MYWQTVGNKPRGATEKFSIIIVMDSINSLFAEFDDILKKYNTDNYRKLNSPLPGQKIDPYLKEFKISDSNFKLFYSWKNGNDLDDISRESCQIFNFGSLVSLDSVSKFIKRSDLYWDHFFIPIIATGDGDYLLYNNNEKEDDYGRLHLFSPSLLFIEEPISYYDSIFAMLKTTTEAYKQSALSYNSMENWLDINIDKYYEIAKRINIDSKYWTLLK